MFKRRKMNDQFNPETQEEEEQINIPFNDRRRVTQEGYRGDPEDKPKEPQRSPREIDLENKLKAETERREAAEAKLVGVQAKFEEAKAGLEKETAEMRAR